MLKFVKRISSIPAFYVFSGNVLVWLFVLSILILAFGSYYSLFIAPSDYLQGDAFRILYVHVPCAILSLALYAFMAMMSLIFLVWRIKLAFILALASSGVGALVTIGALFSGAVWGKPMWGAFWVWDARLTSELLLLFLYFGYIALYNALDNKVLAMKACSLLGILGFIDVPVIHYSVNWWYTLHQGASLLKLSTPSIAKEMLDPLLVMLLGFVLFLAAVIILRVRILILDFEVNSKWLREHLNG